MSIYNLKPYIGGQPLVGGYNLPPYVGIIPIPIQLGAVAWWQFFGSEASSDIIEGATSTDVAGWKDKAFELKPTQLLTNSDFDTDVSGWNNNDNTVVVNNGIAEITSTVSGGFSSSFTQGFSTTESGWYNLNFKVTKVDNPSFKVFILPAGAPNLRPISIDLAVGTYDEPFYYDSTVGTGTGFTVYFELALPNIGEQLFLDYVRLKEYELPPYNLSQNTAASQPTFTQPNGPVSFDGNDYLEESSGSLDFATNFTIAVRFKLNSTGFFPRVFSTKSTFSDTYGFYLAFGNSTSTIMEVRGSGSTVWTPTIDSALTKSNIILRFAGTTVELFQNGISRGTSTVDSVVNSPQKFTVGAEADGSLLINADYDHLSTYQRALSDSEIAKLNAYMG